MISILLLCLIHKLNNNNNDKKHIQFTDTYCTSLSIYKNALCLFLFLFYLIIFSFYFLFSLVLVFYRVIVPNFSSSIESFCSIFYDSLFFYRIFMCVVSLLTDISSDEIPRDTHIERDRRRRNFGFLFSFLPFSSSIQFHFI